MNYNETGYEDALNKVVEMRLKRKQIYGDLWKDNPDWELLAHIKNKYKRTELIVWNKDKDNTYENKIDTLIDLANYTLFMLQNALDKNENTNI